MNIKYLLYFFSQLSVLGDLLRNIDEDENENKRKTAKVMEPVVISSYYG